MHDVDDAIRFDMYFLNLYYLITFLNNSLIYLQFYLKLLHLIFGGFVIGKTANSIQIFA